MVSLTRSCLEFTFHTGQLLLELIDHKDVIRDMKFAPDGSMNLGA